MDRGAWWATVHGVAKSWTTFIFGRYHCCAKCFTLIDIITTNLWGRSYYIPILQMRKLRCRKDNLSPDNQVHMYMTKGFPGGSVVKNLPIMQETQVQSLGQEDPLEKEMATYSRILAWDIPWTEEPCGLQFMGLQRDGHKWVTKQCIRAHGVWF